MTPYINWLPGNRCSTSLSDFAERQADKNLGEDRALRGASFYKTFLSETPEEIKKLHESANRELDESVLASLSQKYFQNGEHRLCLRQPTVVSRLSLFKAKMTIISQKTRMLDELT